MNQLLETLLHSDRALSQFPPENVVFVILLSFTLGHAMGWTYMSTHQSLSYSQTFVASIVILPTIVAIMMVLMTGSLVVAFGFLAMIAVVRFRNVLKDTRDTTFVLWAIVEGLATGTHRYSLALIATVCLSAILFYLRLTSFGARTRFDAVISVLTSGADKDLIHAQMKLHTSRRKIFGNPRRTSEGRRVTYWAQLRDPERADDLQADLEKTPGVSDVRVQLRHDENEV